MLRLDSSRSEKRRERENPKSLPLFDFLLNPRKLQSSSPSPPLLLSAYPDVCDEATESVDRN